MRSLHISLGILLGSISTALLVSAWTGPTGAPPTNNIAAPINVSSASQVKNGNLSVNGLSVTGTAVIAGGWASTPTTTSYLNFSNNQAQTLPDVESSGYGIRDNNGTIEIKNKNSAWYTLNTIIQNYLSLGVTQVKFNDGTVQTSAAAPSSYYDSGWFFATVATSAPVTLHPGWNTYTINHNLGTTNVEVEVYAQVPGSGVVLAHLYHHLYFQTTCYDMGYGVTDITANSVVINFPRNSSCVHYMYYEVGNMTSGLVRVIVKRL